MWSSSRLSRNKTLILPILIVVFGATAGFLAAGVVKDTELRKLFWTGAITLIFGALLGGVVQLLLAELVADLNRRRLALAEEAQFITNVLNDLKAVYDRVERARVLIPAHQSALTYGNEMRDLIEARVKLQNVLRSLAKDPRKPWITGVKAHVVTMDQYLERVVVEFRSEYKKIADRQKLHEARVEAHLKKLETAPTSQEGIPENEPWVLLRQLPQLNDLLESGPEAPDGTGRYKSEFLDSLDDACRELRNALLKPSAGENKLVNDRGEPVELVRTDSSAGRGMG